ncbi:MAG: arginine--tRNA ligase [Opitutales bacterium]|nr:arginine--tRNA ligase [Opitutales bacterium]
MNFHLTNTLHQIFSDAAAGLAEFGDEFNPDIRTADPRFGDFQANGVLPFAKKQKTNPRALAGKLVDALPKSDLAEKGVTLEIAGPGFINIRLGPEFLLQWLSTYQSKEDLSQGASALYRGRKMVVDFSSPNTAKQMHVGHIRSMVIGESIARLLDFCGAEVIRDNHLGDWGTPMGKVLLGYRRFLDREALEKDALEELERLYKKVNALGEEDPKILDEARAELVRLQNKEPDSYKLWQEIIAINEKALERIYQLLDIRFDHHLGESFYEDKLEPVYRELSELKISEESQGAQVVFHPEHPRFKSQPFIIRKSDGASNYATTDLATALYRVEEWKADGLVYVTDGRQQDHFQQLFLTVEKWFSKTSRPIPKMSHVWFGTILGEDGKAIKTRSGDPIRLKDLLREAEERALRIVREKNPDLPMEESQKIAQTVGIAAIKYADLSQNRTSDYVFAWDKLLSFDGNTAPYLLYAVARIHSIFSKADISPYDDGDTVGEASPFETPQELALARKLTAFSPVLAQTTNDLRPHYLCTYLFELATEFSAFYNADKVLTADPKVRSRRILLCRRTLLFMETGLHLLGVQTLKKM